MARSKLNVELNEEQEAESQQIYERLRGAFDEELKTMARFMASKPNHQLFGQTELELRDRVHELGARVSPRRPPTSGKKRGGYEDPGNCATECGRTQKLSADRWHSSTRESVYRGASGDGRCE
jgi:hypothetical protein